MLLLVVDKQEILRSVGKQKKNLRLAKLSKICQIPPKIYLFCRALENYTVVARQGDDGTKPDFMARKSCNFITESVEVDF